MNRFIGSAMLGVAMYFLARGVGIPAWTTWQMGDATDVGLTFGVGVWLLSRMRVTA